MGLIQAFSGAIGGTFADQWKDIITAGVFTEQTVVSLGILRYTNNGRGANFNGSDGIITNGSKIYIPENTAAFIFSESGIEEIITEPGGYEYQNGQSSIFNGDGFAKSIVNQARNRFEFGGISADQKKIAFVNLREIRDIKFGTRGPQVYNDLFYGTDLEIVAYGSFTIKVCDAKCFIQNFVPANVLYYNFYDARARSQIVSEFLQSFITALNSLSQTFRISQLPSQVSTISERVANDSTNAGSWPERFGFKVVKVAVENIEFTEESRELIKQYNTNKLNLKAYDEVSIKASNIAAQQKIAQGIQDNGLNETGNMLFGLNMGQALGANADIHKQSQLSLDEQVGALRKLKELMDAGILTEEEFNIKKKEIMDL